MFPSGRCLLPKLQSASSRFYNALSDICLDRAISFIRTVKENAMSGVFAALLGLLVWIALGVFVAFCIGAGKRNARRRL